MLRRPVNHGPDNPLDHPLGQASRDQSGRRDWEVPRCRSARTGGCGVVGGERKDRAKKKKGLVLIGTYTEY